MSDETTTPASAAGPGATPCPACGKPARGRYCSHCGAQLEPAACAQCDALLQPGDKYCFECGARVLPPEARVGEPGSVDAGAAAPVPASRPASAAAARTARVADDDDDDADDEEGAGAGGGNRLAWIIGTVAVIAVIGIATWRSMQDERMATQAGQAAQAVGMGGPMAGAAGGAATGNPLDMQPTQMADALYDRIMRLSAEGKKDSVAFFFNNVVGQVYQMIGTLDLDQHYDYGNVAHAAGHDDQAAAHADTILAADPKHLLGLALKFRAEQSLGNTAAAKQAGETLVASQQAEMGKAAQKPEYTRHSTDIELAVAEAKAMLGKK